MKKLQTFPFWLLRYSILFYLLLSLPVTGQVVPDTTLPNNSSVANEADTRIITGGTVAGSNLFHSFEQFSVPTGSTAYFNNTLDIKNIISRVTGGSISNIDGLIRANGTANFFLLNPNGIIFGPNASLNIGGSFFGSTASSLNFADGTQFSPTAPQTTPLLIVSVPIGLQFGQHPGSIRNQSVAVDSISGIPVGLQVQPGKTLALVGGDLALEGGNLTAEGGRIELGSVAGPSLVSLNPTAQGWALGYEGVQNFRDIQLSQQATVDVSGIGGGNIQVRGRQVTLTESSQISSTTLGSEPGGTLSVTASESVELIGIAPNGLFPSNISTTVFDERATGAGSNLIIETKQLSIRDGAGIQAVTFGPGSAGNLTVNAEELVELSGATADAQFGSGIITTVFEAAKGSGGNLTINTKRLSIRDGAQIQATTFGLGSAGNLTVNAEELVELSGTVAGNSQLVSGLVTSTEGSGSGGSLTVKTRRLSVRDGAGIGASTFGLGPAGSLVVNAKESVELSGASADGQSFSILTARTRGVGDAGDLRIETGRLSVWDGAEVTVSSTGTGEAGDLEVTARSIGLYNEGKFTATTESGKGGGNISLQELNLLLLRGNSNISTNAGGSGNGGNITINADLLVALENSDITADAVRGRGGNIQISTQGLFRSPDSDITASSQLGIDGVVEVRNLGFDVQNTLTPFTGNFVSTEQVMANSCLVRRNAERGSFVVTGSGGLPLNPYSGMSEWELLTKPVANVPESPERSQGQPTSNQVATNRIPVAQVDAQRSQHNPTSNQETAAVQPSEPQSDSNEIVIVRPEKKWNPGDPIVEAQALMVTPDGRMLLTSAAQQGSTASAEDLLCQAN